MRSRRVAELLLLSGMAFVTPVLSQAAPTPPEAAQRSGPAADRGMRAPGAEAPHAPGLPFFLGRVRLSEEQDDRVFALVHAQEPALRNARKTEERTHHDLLELVMSGNYDDAKAAELARAGASAAAEASLIRARIDSQVLAILTPEQRRAITERPPEFAPQGHDTPALR